MPKQTSLRNWPVQMHLVPPKAPFFDGVTLLLTADCVPFALPGFHEKLVGDRAVVVGCPRFDNADFYRKKLTQLLLQNDVQAIEVAYMEVPCCLGLVRLAHQALQEAGKELPLVHSRVSVEGQVSEPQTLRVQEGGSGS